jgi:two-component sensor histidine kinase
MFFGGFNGATAFYPSKITDNSFVPRTVLTDFRLSGISVPIRPDSPLTRSITYTHSITLSHWQNIFSIEFSALSYFNASANRYRYKLEGLDHDWHEVGSDQRIASYTTLPEGKYKFRVQGATSRGTWDEPGASLDIFIEPLFWQTWWFIAICMALFVAALWATYAFRIRHITTMLHIRHQERHSEREDIARDLHDTFFQAVQSLFLRIHTASRKLPEQTSVRQALDDVLNDSDRVMAEGREMFLDMPDKEPGERDFADVIAGFCAECAIAHPIEYRVEVDGQPRSLSPLVSAELGKIAREAIYNAFRHSKANLIEVELTYGKKDLRLRVRDDGQGFEPALIQSDSGQSHLGLQNMRKRAERLGAEFGLWSRLGSGTELEFILSSQRAFGTTHRTWTYFGVRRKG